MKPFNDFDCKIHSFYWRIIVCDDEPRVTWACWHMFRPYNNDIFKVGMGSSYFFRKKGV